MAGSVVQVRIDEKLKKEVSKVYENLGLDLSSAVRMFFKRSVQVGGIPFSVSNEKSYDFNSALSNIIQTRNDSVKNGTDPITLDEINAEIKAYRSGRWNVMPS